MLFELFFHDLINFASVELFISLLQFFFANDEDFLLLIKKSWKISCLFSKSPVCIIAVGVCVGDA